MDLKLETNNIIFIEETCFLADEFYQFLINLFSSLNGRSITIYVEQNIDKIIDDYKKTDNDREAYTIEGFIDIFKQMKNIQKIETKGYFDFTEIRNIIKNNKFLNVLILTRKESIYKSFMKLVVDYEFITLARFSKGLIEWNSLPKSKEDAFFIDNDIYINKVDINHVDYVYSPKFGHLKLNKSKHYKGGEGILYRTYNNQLCKLYYDEHQTYVNYKKIEHMLEVDIYNPYINWPKDILFYKNDFVGYLMDEIKGAKSLDVLRINMFEGYNIFDLYVLSYNLLLNIDYLHKKNILIGDLKLDNILVKSPVEVYLVDCGCYQINDFSCDVCHPEYTKKVYTNEELKKKLRTFEDEYYPINKIIFELLIGKNPNYNRHLGEVDIENKNNFSFPLDLNQIQKYTRELILWRGLSDKMREFFYYYFKENKVTYLSDWIDELEIYIENAKAKKRNGER